MREAQTLLGINAGFCKSCDIGAKEGKRRGRKIMRYITESNNGAPQIERNMIK
jgi:hypothetical protein